MPSDHNADAGEYFRVVARLEDMLNELRSSHFEVVLVPPGERRHSGHKLRALQSANPRWYSKLCSEHVSFRGRGRRRYRRPRTFIKRATTIAALQRMIGGDLSGIYAARILSIIRREQAARASAAPANRPDYFSAGIEF